MRCSAACSLLLLGTLAADQLDFPAETRKARDLLLAGETRQAIEIYRRLSLAAPRNADLLLDLAIAEVKDKRFEDAAGHAAAALELSPALLPARLILGASLLESGRVAEAVPPLEAFANAMPQDRNARLLLSRALLALRRLPDALTSFRKTADLLPNDPRTWHGLGLTHEAMAEALGAELCAEDGSDAIAHTIQARRSADHGQYARALDDYQAALERDPELPGLLEGLAEVYRASGHAEWAAGMPLAERPIAADQGSGRRGRYLNFLSHRREAAEAFAQLERLPPSFENHLRQATVLDQQARFRESAAVWRAALAASPGNSEAALGLAWSLYRQREFGETLRVLDPLVKGNRPIAHAHALYGATLLAEEQPAAALPHLETALRLQPDLLPAHAALGHALLRLGRPQEASAYLARAAAVDNEGSTRFQLFRAYQLMGREELAREAFLAYQATRLAARGTAGQQAGIRRLTLPPALAVTGSPPRP